MEPSTNKSKRWLMNTCVEQTKSIIDICPDCLKKYVKTPKSPDKCLMCFGFQYPKVDYKYKEYKPKQTWTEIRLKINKSIREWRKRHPDKVNQWKREHKKRHPESVKAWNERYRDKNKDRLKLQFRLRYKIIKHMKTVNDNILVKPINQSSEVTTSSGIITQAETSNIRKGIVKYVCLKPSVAVKKEDIVVYSYGIHVTDKGEQYEIVSLKEVLAIE